MNIKSGLSTAVAIIAMLGLTSPAWAGCNIELDDDGNPVTGAASVYELSGQGNISCADLNMRDITSSATTLTFNSKGTQLDFWETSEEADAVLIKPSNGNRCVYNYPTIATSGQFLTPSNNKAISDVKICSDDRDGIAEPVVAEAPILPTTTAGATACIGVIDDGDGALDFAGGVVMAESLDGQVKAVCNAEAGIGQAYCEDSCVGFQDVGESAACLGSVLTSGEFGLAECKPCLTALDLKNDSDPSTNPPVDPSTGLDMEFCWEKTGSVYEGAADLGGLPPQIGGLDRTAGTMLKHTAIRQSDNTITWFNKCYKTSTEVNGRTYWITTCR